MVGKTNGGSGGSSLNYKVIAYASEAGLLAAAPAENTIGVVTATPITARVFSATEPQGLIDGAVWFLTGTNSPTAFNALKAKKDAVMVYPMSAKQSVDGVLVDVVAKSYIGGKWVDWWSGELFLDGNEYEYITGGWSCTVASAFENTGKVLAIESSSSTPRVHTNNAIDLTEYSAVVSDLNLISRNTFRLSITKKATDTNYVATGEASKTGQQQLTIDVSAITGSYYIQFAAYLSKAEIQSVRLVR